MNGSTPYSKEGRQGYGQNFNVYRRVDSSMVKTRCKNHTCLFSGFVHVIFDVRRELANVVLHYPKVFLLITFVNSFVTEPPVPLFKRLTIDSFCFFESDNTAFIIVKFIPPLSTASTFNDLNLTMARKPRRQNV